jgi:hypothetical protein
MMRTLGKDALIMLRKNTLLLLVGLVSSSAAFAASPVIKDFTVGDSKMKIKSMVPEGWDSFVNLYNTPLSLVSQPGLQDKATVIQIAPFDAKDNDDNFADIKKDPENYYSQKEEQVEGLDGDIISYLPFEESKKDGATIYSIGVKYKNTFGEFLDQTYFVTTKSKELFYVKALVPLDQLNAHDPIVSQVINTLSTKN